MGDCYAYTLDSTIEKCGKAVEASDRHLGDLLAQLIQRQDETNRLLAQLIHQQAATNALLKDANSGLWERAWKDAWNKANHTLRHQQAVDGGTGAQGA